jgi:hypothetical protein
MMIVTTTGPESLKDILQRNLLHIGKDIGNKYYYSVFRKQMNIESEYYDEFSGKSK